MAWWRRTLGALLVLLATAAPARGEDPPAPDPAEVMKARLQVGMGRMLGASGNPEAGVAPGKEGLSRLRALYGGDHADVLAALAALAETHRALGQLADALPLQEEALAMARRLHGGDHEEVAACLGNLAITLGDLGRAPEAIALEREALDLSRRLHPEGHDDVVVSLLNLAASHERMGAFAESLSLRLEALALERRLRPGDRLDTGIALTNLAAVYRALQRPADALALDEEALALFRRLGKRGEENLALTLNNLAVTQDSLGRHADALPRYEEALALFRRLRPGDSPSTAATLLNLGDCLDGLLRSEDALRRKQEALEMHRRLAGNDSPEVARSLLAVGTTLGALGRHGEALPLQEEALRVYRGLFPGDAPDVAVSLNNVAQSLSALGRAQNALPLQQEAFAMRRRLHPGGHSEVVRTMGNLAMVLEDLGRSAEALPLHEEALALLRRAHPGDDPMVALALNNLGHSLDNLGRPADALPVKQEALAMRRALHPGDHAEVAGGLNNLAYTYGVLGREAEALPLREEALAMFRRLHAGDHAEVALALNNLAVTLSALGQEEEALPLREEALAMSRRLYPGDHPRLALTIQNLAWTYTAAGRAAEALPLQEEALAMTRRLYPGDHPDVAAALVFIAFTYGAIGRKAEALSALEEAAEMEVRSGSATRHRTLAILGTSLLAEGRAAEAVAPLEASVAQLEHLRAGAKSLGTADRAAYMAEVRRWEPFQPLAEALVALDRIAEALGTVERGRGREMLDLLARGRLDPLARAEERARARGDAESLARLEVARAGVLAAGEAVTQREREEDGARQTGSRGAIRAAAAAAVVARKALEAALAAQHRLVGEVLPETAPLPPERIQALLGERERMLVYALGDRASFVFVVGPATLAAHALHVGGVPLTTAGARERVEAALEGVSSAAGEARAQESLSLLQALLPEGAWTEIRACERIYLVGHGALHALPFEALVVGTKDGRPVYWLDEGPPVAYVASATVLSWVRSRRAAQREEPAPLSLVAVGDPVFETPKGAGSWPKEGVLVTAVRPGGQAQALGLRPGDVLVRYGDRPLTDMASLRDAMGATSGGGPVALLVRRGAGDLSFSAGPGPLGVEIAAEPPEVAGPRLLAGGSLAGAVRGVTDRGRGLVPLPGTRDEVNRIADAFRAREGARTTALLGSAATEAALTASVSGARFVHLATHGIVDETETASFSGLALTAPLVPVPGDDGYLSLTDLLSGWRGRLDAAELVVLSACDTQRGRLRRDEGVFALPWGLHFAGCPTVVATLWKVADETTPALMAEFYRRVLATQGADRLAALVEAKRSLRATHPHPFYWAPFVLLGEPR